MLYSQVLFLAQAFSHAYFLRNDFQSQTVFPLLTNILCIISAETKLAVNHFTDIRDEMIEESFVNWPLLGPKIHPSSRNWPVNLSKLYLYPYKFVKLKNVMDTDFLKNVFLSLITKLGFTVLYYRVKEDLQAMKR